jgi:hypothetical protein
MPEVGVLAKGCWANFTSLDTKVKSKYVDVPQKVYEMMTGIVRTNVTLSRVRVTIVAMEQQYVLHITSVCLFLSQLSGIQIVPFLCRKVLSSVACLAVPYFSKLSRK